MSFDLDVDLELMRAAALLDRDPAAAAVRAARILDTAPSHPEAALLVATASRQLGDPGKAVELLEPVIRAQPESASLWFELGRAQSAARLDRAAEDTLRHAIGLDDRLADAWRLLAELLHRQGDAVGGDRAYRRFQLLSLNPPELADATQAIEEDRVDTAEGLLRARLQATPGDTIAYRMLAICSAKRNDFDEAAQLLGEVLVAIPGDAIARLGLVNVLSLANRDAEAIPHLDRLIAAFPDESQYALLKVQAYRQLGSTTEARQLAEQLLERFPDDAGVWLGLGAVRREAGDRDGAVAAFRRAQVTGAAAGALWALANMKRFRFEPADAATIEAELERPGLSVDGRVQLEFAYGAVLEQQRDYERSFLHYSRGNALHRSQQAHVPEVLTEQLDRARSALTAEFFADRANFGSPSREPIFVVGVPRSGSTLIEQILASHSAIEGTFELADLSAIAKRFLRTSVEQDHPGYPASLVRMDPAASVELAAGYLERVRRHRPLGRPHFVDKMLGNFLHVGLIQLLFPHAAIIDARRHPLGSGFSCYKQLFARGITYCYELGELGRHLREYAELMQHYETVLPGRIHRVHYEQLVLQPEETVRGMLAACGLPFEDACLRFYETRRVVRTISAEQVREPIYTDSLEQWRNFDPWLGPLREALGPWAERYPKFES